MVNVLSCPGYTVRVGVTLRGGFLTRPIADATAFNAGQIFPGFCRVALGGLEPPPGYHRRTDLLGP